ncbi:unnamed protein product [Mesocestoides corti]|uniref:PHD-type domain-containing protein n=1 Tax=Mesocestoides corti TaxID=53468 RepID=A0A3P6HME8_MESCO|nr:unnamed protein product [Mesocestoides corti]
MSLFLFQNSELFTLTYGSLVAQIVKDFESDEAINEQLDTIGYNIGEKLAEDFVARGNQGRCSDFKETATQVVNGFKLFLGISPTVSKFSPAGDEFSLIFDTNPLTEFVDLPVEHSKLLYCNVFAGAIRGALHNLQLEVDAKFVQDQLRGDKVTEIRVKFIRRIKEVFAGLHFRKMSTPGTNATEAWLTKGLRLFYSQKPEDAARLRRFYKEACENEAAVLRTTLAEALRAESTRDESAGERGAARSKMTSLGAESAAPPRSPRLDQSDLNSSTSSALPRRASLINLFDVAGSVNGSSTAASPAAKVRNSSGSASVPLIPVVVCQGKTIIPEQPQVVVPTNIGGASSPPVAMEAMADLVADLMCCVCGRMTAAEDAGSQTNNVLVECSRCRGLYHQLCHSPPLIGRAPTGWLCAKCVAGKGSKRKLSLSPSPVNPKKNKA